MLNYVEIVHLSVARRLDWNLIMMQIRNKAWLDKNIMKSAIYNINGIKTHVEPVNQREKNICTDYFRRTCGKPEWFYKKDEYKSVRS